jgi:FdhD protein
MLYFKAQQAHAMPNPNLPIELRKYANGAWHAERGDAPAEMPVTLTVNGEAWLEFMCTPEHLDALAVGFLYNEGLIQNVSEVAGVHICEHGDNADVWLTHSAEQPAHWRRTSGCTGGVTAADVRQMVAGRRLHVPDGEARVKMTPESIGGLMGLLLSHQSLYRTTGGVHTSALSDGHAILVSAEDIGRHNTLDKIAGICLLESIWPEPRILLTTGRVSSEMMQKAVRLGAAVVVSRTAASSLAVQIAEEAGITLIGYCRSDRFTVYAHAEHLQG